MCYLFRYAHRSNQTGQLAANIFLFSFLSPQCITQKQPKITINVNFRDEENPKFIYRRCLCLICNIVYLGVINKLLNFLKFLKTWLIIDIDII